MAKKPGITEAALLAAGAKLAKYKSLTVISLPIIGESLDVSKSVGRVLANCIGDDIPKWDKTGKVVGKTKIKNTYGSGTGLIGQHAIEKLRSDEPIDVIWKVEGISDMLALQAAIPEDKMNTHLVVTNSFGTKEEPRWQAKVLARSLAVVCHDCDVPGQPRGCSQVGRRDRGSPS